MNRLWCCICIHLPQEERPEGWEEAPLTIIAGDLVCEDHIGHTGPNMALVNFRRHG